MNKKTIKDIDVNGKKVLVRVDFNVPISDGKITDDNRIIQALDTIKYLIDHNAKVILLSHLGKVKEESDKLTKTLKPVAERLEELLNQKVIFVPETRGSELEQKVNELQPKDVLMIENTRFEDLDGKKESKNDSELAKYWAKLSDDILVIDAFGTAHRAHASNVGIASNVSEAVAGFLIEKEINFLQKAIDEPKRPLVAILGGAKVSDKIGVIENLIKKADNIIIGGGMMFTFLKAQGYNVGSSLVEEDKIELAKDLLEKANGKICLPIDVIINNQFANEGDIKEVSIEEIPENYMGLDIGHKSVEKFATIIKEAKTIVWNGPMGVFEFSNFNKGTIGVCDAIAQNQEAITIIGGGDSAAAAISLGYSDKFSHISTGGGASLEFLEGKKLPGIECLTEK